MLIVERNQKGRRVGQTHHRAKLSADAVAQIRHLRSQGMALSLLAKRFNCGKTTVWKIVHRVLRNQSSFDVLAYQSSSPDDGEKGDHTVLPWNFQDRLKTASKIKDPKTRMEVIDDLTERARQTCPKRYRQEGAA